MDKYANIKKVIVWVSQYESQLTTDEQWDDQNFAKWLYTHVEKNSAKTKEQINAAKVIQCSLFLCTSMPIFMPKKF
ncbi:MAG: hypothetical protein FGM61_07185 [Sediminibacterium sp.]|nr:hypothetical protein [Sediminibacterium sp.]